MTGDVAGRCPSRTLLSMFSIFQLNSPSVLAPTRRPLPLSVWKTRRTGCSRSVLLGSAFHAGSSCARLAISSSNSSRKISRISSSISSLVASKPAEIGASTDGAGGADSTSGSGAGTIPAATGAAADSRGGRNSGMNGAAGAAAAAGGAAAKGVGSPMARSAASRSAAGTSVADSSLARSSAVTGSAMLGAAAICSGIGSTDNCAGAAASDAASTAGGAK